MSIPGLLARGIRSVLAEPEAAGELAELAGGAGLAAEAAGHIRQTLEAMPELLVAIERSLATAAATKESRALFEIVVRYALEEDDLIPSHAGKPLLGLLDDVYFLHVVAYELRDQLEGVNLRNIAGGAALLESVLPRGVIGEIKDKIRESESTTS